MTVLVKKEWLREVGRGERLGPAHSSIHWPAVWRWCGVLAIAFATVFLFIWQNVQIVRGGYEIEELKKRLASLQTQNSLLTVEAASIEDLVVMERRALAELEMKRPEPGQIVYARGPRLERTDGAQEERLSSARN